MKPLLEIFEKELDEVPNILNEKKIKNIYLIT
jgi:hypothetical protein